MKNFIFSTLLIVVNFKVTCVCWAPILEKKGDATKVLDLCNFRGHTACHEGHHSQGKVEGVHHAQSGPLSS